MIRKITLICIILFLFWISFFPETVQDRYKIIARLFLSAVLLLVVLKQKSTKDKRISKLDLFFWIYILAISLNINFAERPDIALNRFLTFSIPAILIFYLFKIFFDSDNYKIIFASLLIFSSIVAIFGISELIFKKNFLYDRLIFNTFYNRFILQGRIMSTLMHPNVLGSYLLACCPFAYYFAYYGNSAASRKMGVASFVILISGIIFTLSRGTWLAGIIVLSVFFIKTKRRRLIIVIFFIFLIFSLYSQFLSNNNIFKYRFGIFSLAGYMIGGHRTMKYPITLKILSKHPFIGLGLGHYRLLFDRYSDKCFPEELKISDSVYLNHLGETGIIGFLVFFCFLIIVFKEIFYYLRLSKENNLKIILAIIAFALFGLLLNMATYDVFYWFTPMYLFWVLVGMAVAVLDKKRQINDI